MTIVPRRALAIAVLALLGCGRSQSASVQDATIADVATAKQEKPALPPDLSIFFASDVRGHVRSVDDAPGSPGGLARRATLIDRARINSRAVVVVDAGDFLPSRTDEFGGDAGNSIEQRIDLVLASYKRMGVTAVTPGERELELGASRLGSLLRAANLRAVAANLVNKKGELVFERDALIETPTISVGVFGVVEPSEPSSANLERLGLGTTDAVEAARASVQSLRERGAGIVVGLFNVAGGTARAAEIARQAGDLDVVVLGHGGENLKPGVAVEEGHTPIVYAGALGSDAGWIDVRSSDGGRPAVEVHTIGLTRSIPDHFGVRLLEEFEPARVRAAEEKAAAAERRRKGQKEHVVWETWSYGSSGACLLCHTAAGEQWKTTDHAQAMAILKKNHHDHDSACLGCHTTGYLQPGGTQKVDTAVEQFSDVGCECCHGPSALHVRSIDKKKGTSRKVDATVCLGCHTPDQNLGPFDYEAALKSILGPGHGAPAQATR